MAQVVWFRTVSGNFCTKNLGYTITNTLTDTIQIPVTKIWVDSENQQGERPEEITLVLYGDGAEVQKVSISGGNFLSRLVKSLTGTENVWEYTFRNLPEYDENGKRIVYTVKEEEVPEDYEVTYDGYTIRNEFVNHKDAPYEDREDTDQTIPENVNTGDGNHPLFWGLLLAAAAVSGFLFWKKGTKGVRKH